MNLQNDKELTGYPSIDKPWLKYYSEEAINAPLPECTIYEYLWENNKDHLDDVALIYFGKKITYRKLFKNIDKAARAFSAIGVKKGNVVTLSVANVPETVYSLYALNRLGAISNMIDPRTNIEGMHDYFLETKTQVVVTIDLVYPLILKAAINTDIQSIVVCSAKDSMPTFVKIGYNIKNKSQKNNGNSLYYKQFIKQGQRVSLNFEKLDKDTCCVIAHTGGTTGLPKGVMLSNYNINAIAHAYRYTNIPFKRQDKYFNDLPPFIMYGLCLGIHTTLSQGLKVILYPIFDSKGFPEQFIKYRPNHFSDLPDHLYYLSSSKKLSNLDLSTLVSVGVGGDSLSEELEIKVNRFLKEHKCKFEVIKGYGMTELSGTAVLSSSKSNAIGSVGIPLIKNIVKIVDIDTLQELTYNKVGEIWISSPSAMIAYHNNKKETDELIVTDEGGKHWVRTGDLGYMDKDGLLFHKGRIRRIYLTTFDGQPAKIFPMLIEDIINHTKGVSESSVVGRKRENSDYYEAVAFIVADIGIVKETLINTLKKNCEEKLPSYMLPVNYYFIDCIPLTPIGKVDFIMLEKLAEEKENEPKK